MLPVASAFLPSPFVPLQIRAYNNAAAQLSKPSVKGSRVVLLYTAIALLPVLVILALLLRLLGKLASLGKLFFHMNRAKSWAAGWGMLPGIVYA